MKLVASLITHNEIGRYLKPCVQSLEEFVDEIRVLDDFSDDGTYEWLLQRESCYVLSNGGAPFFAHEGDARNALLDWTLEGTPTHVLAIDADEFVTNGQAVRQCLTQGANVWTLKMEEVWKIDQESLWIRNDGGWHAHQIPCLWRVPEIMRGEEWRISDRALACGREPVAVRNQFRKAIQTGESILHFGWTNEGAREARYQRYVTHDGGAFHANQHIQSIMYPDNRVRLQGRPWPESLIALQEDLLERVTASATSMLR